MCFFVTLIVPTDDEQAVRSVMEHHGRAARPISNASVLAVLRGSERQFLTTPFGCDCGSVLSEALLRGRRREADHAEAAIRRRHKGWSGAKIARAIADRRSADQRSTRKSIDSIDVWTGILGSLGEMLGLGYAGLLIRDFSHDPATESFAASRRDLDADGDGAAALTSLKPGELSFFRLKEDRSRPVPAFPFSPNDRPQKHVHAGRKRSV